MGAKYSQGSAAPPPGVNGRQGALGVLEIGRAGGERAWLPVRRCASAFLGRILATDLLVDHVGLAVGLR